jgi:hypothetical protein
MEGSMAVVQPGVEPLTASELAEPTLHRRTTEAGIWGMAAVNYGLMLQEMLTKTADKVNQMIYWGQSARLAQPDPHPAAGAMKASLGCSVRRQTLALLARASLWTTRPSRNR